MTGKKKSKEEVFTIDLDQNDSFEIPGVTQLLNPAKMAAAAAAKEKEKEAAKKFTLEPTRTVASPTHPQITPPPVEKKPAETPAPQRLKDLGVLFDFQFTTHQSSYRYQTGVPHAESFLQAWQQELLTDMKFDLKTIPFKEPFHEFRFDAFSFLYAAFGVQPQHFIQVVKHPSDSQRVHVLISKQSLASQPETVLAALAEKKEVSGVIEIDLIG